MKKYIISLIAVVVVGIYSYLNWGIPKKQVVTDTNQPASVARNLTNEELYTNDTFGYSVRLPSELEIEQATPYSIHMVTKEKVMGPGPANLIYISVVTPQNKENDGEIYGYRPSQHKKLLTLEVGKNISVADSDTPELAEWFTYTRVSDAVIDGKTAKAYENYKPWEFPGGTTETRYIFEENGYTYILGYYTGGGEGKDRIDPRTAYPVIMSFRTK